MRKQISKSQILLTEIMMSVFIFIVATTFCTMLLFNAIKYKKKTVELDNIVRISSSMMEIVLQEGLKSKNLTELYSDGYNISSNQKTYFFDNNFQITDEKNAQYSVLIKEENNDIRKYTIEVYDESLLYQISSKK